MIPVGPRINLATPPRVSFSNLVGLATTSSFTLPAGMGELQYTAINPNNPGTVTLNSPANDGSPAPTLSASLGPFSGSLFFYTIGGAFTISVTNGAQALVIYFADQVDGG